MHDFNKKTLSILRVSLLALTFLIFVCPSFVDAKTSKEEAFAPIDEEAVAYPKGKKGCEMKSAMFVATMEKYKAGKSVEEIVGMKIIQPVLQTIYDNIREKGVVRATIENMEGYQECLVEVDKNGEGVSDPELTLKHRACKKMNAIILETLDVIENRKSLETLMMKYERYPPDMSWTKYEYVPDPALYFIAKIYKAAKNGKYEDAVELGSNISVACYM